MGSNSGLWSRSSGKDSWVTSSVSPPAAIVSSSVWGGALGGWRSGSEVGSPRWARICVGGSGSVSAAMNVRGVWQVGQISGKAS